MYIMLVQLGSICIMVKSQVHGVGLMLHASCSLAMVLGGTYHAMD